MSDEEKVIAHTENTTEAETEVADESKTAQETEINWVEEANKYKDLYFRNAAETENIRRRFQKERDELLRYASECVIKGILPVLDNLEMALAYVKEDAPAEVKSLAEGVKLTLKGLLDVLTDNGVEAIESERGQIFDPNIHEALGQVPESEIEPGTISQLIQRGYILNKRLVRPAKVMVAAASC